MQWNERAREQDRVQEKSIKTNGKVNSHKVVGWNSGLPNEDNPVHEMSGKTDAGS